MRKVETFLGTGIFLRENALNFTDLVTKFNILGISILCLTSLVLRAQNQGNAILANFGYGYFQPYENLSARFGGFHSAGLGVDYLTGNDLIFGVRGDFFYGNNVRENTIAGARDQLGNVYGVGGEPAIVSLKMRGLGGYVHVGKLFRLGGEQTRQGIRATIGAGILHHKIRVQDDPQMPTPQFAGEYTAGYDRLTNGLALTQTIGYQLLGTKRRANFYLGLELTEGFTQNRRDVNFFQSVDVTDAQRFDLIVGLRAVWTLPFYLSAEGSERIYY